MVNAVEGKVMVVVSMMDEHDMECIIHQPIACFEHSEDAEKYIRYFDTDDLKSCVQSGQVDGIYKPFQKDYRMIHRKFDEWTRSLSFEVEELYDDGWWKEFYEFSLFMTLVPIIREKSK